MYNLSFIPRKFIPASHKGSAALVLVSVLFTVKALPYSHQQLRFVI